MKGLAGTQGMVSGGFRLLALALRMLLTLFLARYLPLSDVGVFGLLVATTALLPGTAGLGLSYFTNREIVGVGAAAAHLMARDRLLVATGCGVVCVGALIALVATGVLPLPVSLTLFGWIIVVEMIGFDLHLLLNARHKAQLANTLFFLRTAAWIPVFIGLALVLPAWRSIDGLVRVWAGGMLVFAVVATVVLRHVLTRAVFVQPFDLSRFRARYPRALPIWASDISLAFGQNLDRFVVSAIAGVEAAGVYYFFYAIANAVAQVAQAAIIQPEMPHLRTAVAQGNVPRFRAHVTSGLYRLIAWMAPLCVAAAAAAVILAHLLGRAPLLAAPWLPFFLIAGIFARTIADYLGMTDYVLERDARFIGVNLGVFAATLLALTATTALAGLTGAGAGFLLIMTGSAWFRWALWRREKAAV